jgi:hypothetical protein
MEKINHTPNASVKNIFRSFGPGTRAAFIFAIPFTLVDLIHYLTAGTAVSISFPIVFLLYIGCGALAAYFAEAEEGQSANAGRVGASAGVRLWLFATIINTFISLIIGAASLGATLILGIPYLCLCAPFHLVAGALFSALGGALFGFFYRRSLDSSGNYQSSERNEL